MSDYEYDLDEELEEDDDLDDYDVQEDYGNSLPSMKISLYRDRGCTDLVTEVFIIPGVDTLSVDGPCTIRFNEK